MSLESTGSQQQVQRFGDIVMGDGNVLNITQTIQISVAAIQTRSLITGSPYKGLVRFEPTDKEIFFGRDELISDLIRAVSRNNLIFVLGASGSGKSSVVRAGLIPKLKELLGASLFQSFILTPDIDPFESLRISLIMNNYKQADAEIARQGGLSIFTQVIQSLKKGDSQWLFFIDQFEEIFTLCQDLEKRDSFIQSIVDIANSKDDSVKIVLAMRADFLDKFSPYPDLGKLIQQNNLHLVTDMHPDQLRLAIEQPAAKNGVVFENGLIEEIVKDVEGQAGYLPLLQYTLDLLWQSDDISDRTLNINTYRELGGVRGALQRRVDEIYRSLNDKEQTEVKQIFLRLVDIVGSLEEVDLTGRAVSRRAPLEQFQDDLAKQVLRKLIDNNLLVSNSSREQQSTVEIAHEALLSSWQMLKGWIDESKEVIIINNRLSDDARRWEQLRHDNPARAEDELWTGSKLDRVLELENQNLFELTLGRLSKEEEEFISEGIKLRDRRLHEEEERRQRDIKQARKVAGLAITTAGLAVAALAIGGFGWWQQQRSQRIIEDAWIRPNTPNKELLERLPVLQRAAKRYENAANQSKNAQDVDRALAYYRRLVEETHKLLLDSSDSEVAQKRVEIEKISRDAEQSLVSTVIAYRLPELENELRNKKFGQRKQEGNFADYEQRYEGALKLTYGILLRERGVKADSNDDGMISNDEEAALMNCLLLIEIQKLWQKYADCSWYSSEGNVASEQYAYFDPRCSALRGDTLTNVVFDFPYTYAINQLNACKVAPQAADPNS